MLRRPPGQVAPSRGYLLALAIIVLPWLRLADAQQQHSVPPVQYRYRSPAEDGQHHAESNAASTALAALTAQPIIETPPIIARRKNTLSGDADDDARDQPYSRSDKALIPNDVSAQHVAPDLSVRAAPPSSFRTSLGRAGLSQQIARSLDDWEVEDYVLLATVDGDLYASDRSTGTERWHYKASHPMVETRHFRANRSAVEDDFDEIDQYIWVVEPTRDGELYLWKPGKNSGAGLTKTGWTMKKVVEEFNPYDDPESGISYLGDKKTTMVTLNAATGALIKEFGSGGTYINQMELESCSKPNAIADGGSEECTEGGTITVGRTEYTVVIRHTDGDPIASLKYSEWGPNVRDNDLIQQHRATKDNRYITGQHDGKVYGFDYARFKEERPLFTKSLSSPAARVFDVLRRCPTPGADPELIVLPQPPIPTHDEHAALRRSQNVFLNQTEAGSWYALSGVRYPLVLHAPPAPIHTRDWWNMQTEFGSELDESFMTKAMIGIHPLPVWNQHNSHNEANGLFKTLPGPPVDADHAIPRDEDSLAPADPPQVSDNIRGVVSRMPGYVVDFFTNPLAIFILIAVLMRYGKSAKPTVQKYLGWGSTINRDINSQVQVVPTVPNTKDVVVEESVSTGGTSERAGEATEQVTALPVLPVEQGSTPEAESREASPSPAPRLPDHPERPPNEGPDGAAASDPAAKKKKGHRGRRGGVKHKKGANKDKREGSQSREDDPPEATVDEVISKAKQLGAEPKLEPDILTVPNGVEEVSGPILKMGSLEVNEEQQLGTGSNGTVVFAGKWDGRDVAVKRMLVQFNEIASQETRLLRESDDHPNGRFPERRGYNDNELTQWQ